MNSRAMATTEKRIECRTTADGRRVEERNMDASGTRNAKGNGKLHVLCSHDAVGWNGFLLHSLIPIENYIKTDSEVRLCMRTS